jgi:hypothetical protein
MVAAAESAVASNGRYLASGDGGVHPVVSLSSCPRTRASSSRLTRTTAWTPAFAGVTDRHPRVQWSAAIDAG